MSKVKVWMAESSGAERRKIVCPGMICPSKTLLSTFRIFVFWTSVKVYLVNQKVSVIIMKFYCYFPHLEPFIDRNEESMFPNIVERRLSLQKSYPCYELSEIATVHKMKVTVLKYEIR